VWVVVDAEMFVSQNVGQPVMFDLILGFWEDGGSGDPVGPGALPITD